jgi:hypothetical protein
MRNVAITLLATAALAGCQTWGPTWSEVTGRRFNVTEMNVGPTVINLVDGRSPASPIGGAIWIEPGQRRITLTAPTPTMWPGGSWIVEYELNAEPCKRYYIVARWDNPLAPRFTPFIDYVEIVPGCQVPEAASTPAKK